MYILQFPDPRKMQINLTGFLNGRNARSFMGELWDLLVSAQESVTGIPEAFLQQKKDQIKKRLVIISFSLLCNSQRGLVSTCSMTIAKYGYLIIALRIIFIYRIFDTYIWEKFT